MMTTTMVLGATEVASQRPQQPQVSLQPAVDLLHHHGKTLAYVNESVIGLGLALLTPVMLLVVVGLGMFKTIVTYARTELGVLRS